MERCSSSHLARQELQDVLWITVENISQFLEIGDYCAHAHRGYEQSR
jgi:hypothetical protein